MKETMRIAVKAVLGVSLSCLLFVVAQTLFESISHLPAAVVAQYLTKSQATNLMATPLILIIMSIVTFVLTVVYAAVKVVRMRRDPGSNEEAGHYGEVTSN
jgi:hypothetical protein